MSGGIFTGNVLGSRQLGTVGLGADPQVPWWCWDTTNFKAQHANCTSLSDPELRSQCIDQVIGRLCPWSKPPATTTATTSTSYDASKYDQIVTGFQSGAACNSKPVIEYVQAVISTGIDGKWGPKSQTALDKFGKTFEQIAIGCKPPAPSYSAPGTKIVVASTPPASQVTVDPTKVAGESQAGFSDIFKKVPTIAWVGIAGIAGLLLLKASKKK